MNKSDLQKRQEIINKWENLTLANNFVFSKFMENEDLCKKVLSEILGRKIAKIEKPETEKTLKIKVDSKGIRLDVYFFDDLEHVYTIEMQNYKETNLEKRGRYYNSVIDVNLLNSGATYDQLNDTYIIFICTYDPYHDNRSIYTVEKVMAENHNIKYNDGTTHLILNTKGNRDGLSKDLSTFLDAVNGIFSNDIFSDRIKAEVYNIKRNDAWRAEYMSQELREYDISERARKEGEHIGLEKGERIGRQNTLLDIYRKGAVTKDFVLNELQIPEEELDSLLSNNK